MNEDARLTHPWAVWIKVGFLTRQPGSCGKVLRNVVIPWVCILKRLFWAIAVSQLHGDTCQKRYWDTLPRHRHIICRAENGVDEHVAASSETVGGWIVRGHVNDGVDIRLIEGIQQMTLRKTRGYKTYKWNTREIPENDHETPSTGYDQQIYWLKKEGQTSRGTYPKFGGYILLL